MNDRVQGRPGEVSARVVDNLDHQDTSRKNVVLESRNGLGLFARLRRATADIYYQHAHHAFHDLRALAPGRIARQSRITIERWRTERLLASLNLGRPPLCEGNVLVDGLFDNPNYWVCITLLREALGLSHAQETGLLGPDSTRATSTTFSRIGVERALRFADFLPAEDQVRQEAQALLAGTQDPADILDWKLPFDFPASYLYDAILKKQRRAVVDLGHGRVLSYVTEALRHLYGADALLREGEYQLLLLSHANNYMSGSLAWRASQLGIPAIVAYNEFAGCQYFRVRPSDEFFGQLDCPRHEDIDALPNDRAQALASVGRDHVAQRGAGTVQDIGAILAFGEGLRRLDRRAIYDHFGWDKIKPMVVVYAPNWFDYPHLFGMTEFRDYLDWLKATLAVAMTVPSVNWAIRGHPCDEWYGGISLADLMPAQLVPHVRRVPEDWNGSSLMAAADGIVTVQGTIGVEASAIGVPVLVATTGWYSECDFVKAPKGREAYLEQLRRRWWDEIDRDVSTFRAQVFAGWYFGFPDWQDSLLLEDSSLNKSALYHNLPRIIRDNKDTIAREIAEIADWYESGERAYRVFKMRRAQGYRRPDVR